MLKKELNFWKLSKIFGPLILCLSIFIILLVYRINFLSGNVSWILGMVFGVALVVSYINLYYYIKRERKDIFKKVKKNASFESFQKVHEIQKVNHNQFFVFFWKFNRKDGWELNSYKIVQIILWIACIIFFIISITNS